MQIIAKCPGCKCSCRLGSSAADKRIRCPKCRRVFKVPSMDELSEAVEIISRAQSIIYVDEDGRIYG